MCFTDRGAGSCLRDPLHVFPDIVHDAGRLNHFAATTNPLNLLTSDAELDKAKSVVEEYKKGKEFPELSDDQIWKYKELYDR